MRWSKQRNEDFAKKSVAFGCWDDETGGRSEEGAGFEGRREGDELEDVEGEEGVDLDGLVSEEGDDVGRLDHCDEGTKREDT